MWLQVRLSASKSTYWGFSEILSKLSVEIIPIEIPEGSGGTNIAIDAVEYLITEGLLGTVGPNGHCALIRIRDL